MKRTFRLRLGGEEMTVTVERKGDELVVERNGESFSVTVLSSEIPAASTATVENEPSSRAIIAHGPVAASGGSSITEPGARESQPAAETPVQGAVPAPITGTVKEVLAGEGESISKGERVMMMEAMKMDIEIVAPSSGKLSRVFVKAGDTVQEHQPLFSIE